MPQYKVIPLVQLAEPQKPVRFAMDDAKLAELVDSIREQGILQNLGVIVASTPGDGAGGVPGADSTPGRREPAPLYEIVFGHRRYKAACIVGLKEAPCMI